MEFTNSFSVHAPLDSVWNVLVNAQEVAPCVPGAEITEVIDANHYKGTVKVKLGPVQMTYRGEMDMEADRPARTIVLHGKGTGQGGGASGTITTHLESDGDTTNVEIRSQVDITGRVAQFGRGIIQDVANRLLRQFSQCLEQKLQAGS